MSSASRGVGGAALGTQHLRPGALIVPWPWRLLAVAATGIVVGLAASLVRGLMA